MENNLQSITQELLDIRHKYAGIDEALPNSSRCSPRWKNGCRRWKTASPS